MSTYENQNVGLSNFVPFDDTNYSRTLQERLKTEVSVSNGIDTTSIDPFRQGVNVVTVRQKYLSAGPKIGTDNYEHYFKPQVFGQAASFVEYQNTNTFTDNEKFNVVDYIQNGQLVTNKKPIEFNENLQEAQEASIEPITIPFKKPYSGSLQYMAHSVKAMLEDGNVEGGILGSGNSKIVQYAEYSGSIQSGLFLDEGTEYVGGYPPILDLDFDPVALFTLDNTLIDSGPSGFTLTNHNGFFIDGPNNGVYAGAMTFKSGRYAEVSGSNQSAFFITKSLTIEMFVNNITFENRTNYLISFSGVTSNESDNMQYGLSIDVDDESFIYLWRSGSSDNQLDFGLSHFTSSVWNHIAITREIINDEYMELKGYVNGNLCNTLTSSDLATGGTNGVLFIGSLSSQIFLSGFSSISSVKILDKVLTPEQIVKESNKLFTRYNLNQTKPGFLWPGKTIINPFDDCVNNNIVKNINSENSEMLDLFNKSDINLDEDIREIFGVKSMPAGYDVYGLDSAKYGTDSVAFRNLFRG